MVENSTAVQRTDVHVGAVLGKDLPFLTDAHVSLSSVSTQGDPTLPVSGT